MTVTPHFPDNFYGDQNTPENRLAMHRETTLGVRHLNRVQPTQPQPGIPVTLTVTSSEDLSVETIRCWYTTEARTPQLDADPYIELVPKGVAWDDLTWRYIRTWEGDLPPQSAGEVVRYFIAAKKHGADAWVFADNQVSEVRDALSFALYIDGSGTPDWSNDAVIYHIFLDRFNPGEGNAWRPTESLSDLYGGTLRGVIEKLDYIQAMGFNTLWLSPLFASPSHHRYDATDYYTVDPMLGTNEDLARLISTAHQRGMWIIFDIVANHWSQHHPLFTAALDQPESEFRDWYFWDEATPHGYRSFFDEPNMPQLNLTQGSGAKAYFLEFVQHWLRQGVDGYRLDYAYGPPHDFWADFKKACRDVNPETWLFGEIIHTPALQLKYGSVMDGTLDFSLAQGLRETFGHRTWDLKRFEAFLAAHEQYFPPGFSRPAFIDNHDMNRFLFIAGEDKGVLKLALLILFALPGPPIVYYGTEAGLSQERPIHQPQGGLFEEARLPMDWNQADPDLQGFFTRLTQLRKENIDVLVKGQRQVVWLDEQSYAFTLTLDERALLIAINCSSQWKTIQVPKSIFVGAVDQLLGTKVRIGEKTLEIELPPVSGAWVV